MDNNIKRYRIKMDWFEQPATWNRYVRSEPWGDKSPQLGGKSQSSGQEPELSGARPKCPHCGELMTLSKWSIEPRWLCRSADGWGCYGSLRENVLSNLRRPTGDETQD